MLTKTGEYALQAIAHLAQVEDGRPVSGPQIAQATGTPRKYLSMVLASLVRTGVLEASPGRGGGFSLAKRPEQITLADVLKPFEAVLADRRPCPFGKNVCSDDDPCAGHHQWKMVREAFYEFVNGTTVLDLSGKKSAKSKRTSAKTKKRKAAAKNARNARPLLR